MSTRRILFPVALAAALLLGAAIRVWQYALNPSLWMDEALLALNLVGRDFGQLLQPLDHGQAAPVGFLLLQRAALVAFGNSEYALRLIPLLCGLAALPLFWLVARRSLRGPGLLAAALLFALSPVVIFHTVEAKQYSGDVFAALLAAWLGRRLWDAAPATAGRAVGFGLLGAALLCLSHAATFALGGAALCLLISALSARDWPRLRALAPTLGLWALTVATLYALALRGLTQNAFLLGYWSGSFAPFPPLSGADLRWYSDAFTHFLADPLGLVTANFLYGTALLAGTAAIAWLDRRSFWLLGAPLALALIASALHRYPFSDRLLVFLVPGALISMGASITALWANRRPWLRGAAVVGALALVASPSLDFARDPLRGRSSHELRPILHDIGLRQRDNDSLYVYSKAWAAFSYYAPLCHIATSRLTVAVAEQGDFANLRADLQKLAGRGRVWVIFSHVPRRGADARLFTLGVLDTLGHRLDAIEGDGAWAYLYQL